MDIVKKCPMCGAEFSANDLLHNKDLTPLGIRLEADTPHLNYFFFTHDVPNCGTTFVIPVDVLEKCLDEKSPSEILAGTGSCEGHCLELADRGFCCQDCRYAPYRRLMVRMLQERQMSGHPEMESFQI